MSTTQPRQTGKAYKGMAMEGFIARWYARNTARNRADYRKSAEAVARRLPGGGRVLEVAPGPGYLAIELAGLGRYDVVGLDISKSFVEMATANARAAGVAVTFVHGDAAHMPFDADSFDFVVCRAAFKNFADPVQALAEMYRVLRAGGEALIIDLRHDASGEAIDAAVKEMGLGWFNGLLTRLILKHGLLRRAYSEEQFRTMASQTPFQTCAIQAEAITLNVSLTKTPPP
jgi:ubiquinone/menaquinone biosynthesis C-methylase UbiE